MDAKYKVTPKIIQNRNAIGGLVSKLPGSSELALAHRQDIKRAVEIAKTIPRTQSLSLSQLMQELYRRRRAAGGAIKPPAYLQAGLGN
jgi:hypothetical protein